MLVKSLPQLGEKGVLGVELIEARERPPPATARSLPPVSNRLRHKFKFVLR
jgi:hypothetical protein